MDGTPNYVLHYTRSFSLERIAHMYGSARLAQTTFAMILCDPVQRAQSFEYHLGCSGCFRAEAANPSGQNALLNSKYGDQVRDVVNTLGSLFIIPAPLYWSHADLVIHELLSVVEHRCRKRPHASGSISSRPPHAHALPHPPLDEDAPPSRVGPGLAEYFRHSNQYIYDLVYASLDPRVSVVPPLRLWPEDAPQHFLETSSVLRQHIRTTIPDVRPLPPSTPPPAPVSPPRHRLPHRPHHRPSRLHLHHDEALHHHEAHQVLPFQPRQFGRR